MPNLPQPSLPPKAIEKSAKAASREEKAKKASRRQQKNDRQKYMINVMLAFVFGITSVAFFASNPFSGSSGNEPGPSSSSSQDPDASELQYAVKAAEETPSASNEFNLGEVYLKQEKWPEAADAYRKAIDKDPRNIMAMSHLGTVYLEQGKAADAIPILEKARDAENQELAATPSTQPSASSSDDADEPAVDESTVRDINIPESLYAAYIETGKTADAEKELQDARNIDVQHTLGFMLRTSLILDLENGKKDESRAVLKDAAVLSKPLNEKLKDDLYNNMLMMAMYSSSMDKTHPEKEVAAKDWIKMLSHSQLEVDPAFGKKLSDLVDKLNAPPPAVAASGSPATTAAVPTTNKTVTIPAGLLSGQPGKPVVIESRVIDMPAESSTATETPGNP